MLPARVIVRRVALWRSFAAFQSSSLTIRSDGISLVIHSALRIQPRDAFAGVRILDVAQSVPDQAADVQLVVQDARSAFGVPVDGARTPTPAEWSSNPVLIESLGNRFRRDSGNELPEDPFHDRSFPCFDLSLTSRDGATASAISRRGNHSRARRQPCRSRRAHAILDASCPRDPSGTTRSSSP